MDENSKEIIQMMYHQFCNDLDNLTEDLKKSPGEQERIEYGLELIKAEAESEETKSMYSMLWIAYYLGAGTGLEIYDTIMKGEKNDQSRQL